jgi:hypothetical protein
MIAGGECLIGAGLCLIVGFAVDREGRHDLICGVEKEAVIASHGASALSREFEEIQRVVHYWQRPDWRRIIAALELQQFPCLAPSP